MTLLHLLIACEELPLALTPEPDPTAMPSPTASPLPSPLPPATHTDYWPLFNAAACDAAITCGSQIELDAFECPDGLAEPPCEGFDSAAAEQCLASQWTCETLAGEARATPPLACNVVCDPPPQDTAEPHDTGTATPIPVTDPPTTVSFRVTLADGDGVADSIGGSDDDILSVEVFDGTEDYEFGYAQTAVGTANGWFGESCLSSPYCHPITGDSLLLTRVFSINAIVEGQTTLLPVEYPESSTPALTYYAGGVTSGDCWVWGDQPSYYASLNCSANGSTPAVTPPVVTPPVTPAPGVSFTVTLQDGDGAPDSPGVVDADTLTVDVFGGTETYHFGYGQTAVGTANGWFGEDCLGSNICHPIVSDQLVLTRTGSISAVTAGSIMLLNVSFPESSTPELTYYAEGDVSGDCWAWGHQPSHYASLNCQSN